MLDSGVMESDIPAAIRIASAETMRAGRDCSYSSDRGGIGGDRREDNDRVSVIEVLEIARLLIRLSLAAPSLKVGIIAGRVLGDLLVKCVAYVPSLTELYCDFGRSVASLLQAYANGGSAVWLSATLTFMHSATSTSGE